jgi:hypothetical protein
MRSLLGRLLLGAWLAFAVSVLAFATFEMFPALTARTALARDVRYYQLRSRYRPDPRLAFVPAPGQLGGHYTTMGDQYLERYGVPAEPIEMDTSYTEDGFRSNSAGPPYDVVVIGDSYMEIGERDDLTFSELLGKKLGRSTFNLGRAWYGPDQYVALLRGVRAEAAPANRAVLVLRRQRHRRHPHVRAVEERRLVLRFPESGRGRGRALRACARRHRELREDGVGALAAAARRARMARRGGRAYPRLGASG